MNIREKFFRRLFKKEYDSLRRLEKEKLQQNEIVNRYKLDLERLIEFERYYRKNPKMFEGNKLPDSPFFTEEVRLIMYLFTDIVSFQENQIDILMGDYLVSEQKYKKLENTLLEYENRLRDGFLTMEKPEFGVEKMEYEDTWEVHLSICQLGGCSMDGVEFPTKETAEAFTAIYQIIGNKMTTSTCSSCYREYMEGCM